ncbi:MAG: hypothetical protein K2V38_24705, partial [Gemmataceae bacterium]|nr:hypothetical protein [Gemmataceae bacterium]
MSDPASDLPPVGGYVIPARYWAWAGRARARAAFVWLLVLLTGGVVAQRAATWMSTDGLPPERQRADGNS